MKGIRVHDAFSEQATAERQKIEGKLKPQQPAVSPEIRAYVKKRDADEKHRAKAPVAAQPKKEFSLGNTWLTPAAINVLLRYGTR